MMFRVLFLLFSLLTISLYGYGQPAADGEVLNLEDCLKYALKNQPAVNQSKIDEEIAQRNNKIALSHWMPQVTGTANLQHYFELPTNFFNSNGTLTAVRSGLYNYSFPQVSATQAIFNNNVLLALKVAKLNTREAKQNTARTKIEVVSAVSKAFYDLLLSMMQTEVYREDSIRLRKNQSDAYNRYVSGIVDKVDHKQATIALNNSLSRLKNAAENVAAKYAVLRQYMGYPADKPFSVRFDTVEMMQEMHIDTAARLQFDKRIEYQQLQTVRRMQKETTTYYKTEFLPSLSGYYNYVQAYQNNNLNDIYNRAYPYSFVGLQLNIPIFSGFRRIQNIRIAQLAEQRTDWDEVNMKLAIYAEYKQALANYKSNLYYLQAQRENAQMAREVYNIVKLQYSEGVKPYLDVIVAETDLQNSEINYLNALFHLLESKVDLERAMGNISPDI